MKQTVPANHGKKLLALLFTLAILSVCILLLSLPASAETVDSGSCGTNLTYTLDSDGTLKIDGTGAMTNWDWDSLAPWDSQSSQIKTVVIGDSVTGIGELAFYYCTSLTSVTIPDSVTSIGWAAFCGCTSLTSVTIPDSVTSIGERAFAYCTSLTSVTIPDSVTGIGYLAFEGCTSLTAITVAEGNPSYCSIDGILYSADKTELICCPAGKAGSVTIPDSVTGIGEVAFCDCTSLTSVTLGNSVTGIGYAAFAYCTSLTSVTIPDSVTSIGSCAFEDCSSLTSVTIGNSVTSIGYLAFCCTSLTSVTIPDSVTGIGERAFADCRSLTDIYCEAAEQPAGWDEDWLKYCSATVHWGWEPPAGDINKDNIVNIQDVTALLTLLATADQFPPAADVNKDMIVSIKDVTDLLTILSE